MPEWRLAREGAGDSKGRCERQRAGEEAGALSKGQGRGEVNGVCYARDSWCVYIKYNNGERKKIPLFRQKTQQLKTNRIQQ